MSVTAATGVSEYKVLEFGLGKGCLESFSFSPFQQRVGDILPPVGTRVLLE